ncbi:MAG: N-acetylmuramoyl-L-alanine amidase [Clostridia bacterium]|nr:N-acetylmuramoyl-L-alanine amidase [Clostridia bacterium]
MFITIKFKKIMGLISCIIGIWLLTYGVINVNNQKVIFTSSEIFEPNYIIVIDAGHGEPDGGAVSVNGIRESDLNLQVAKLLEEELIGLGYEVIMTRKDENNIADNDLQSSTIRKIKVSDINNRIDITNNSNADMLISIHMNKFSSEKYYGWQTFYKKNSSYSKILAENIQKGINNNIERENKRTELPIENIKLIDKSKIPAVIVECGFLSNIEDVRLLQTEEYRKQIVNGIIEGIEEFYSIDK